VEVNLSEKKRKNEKKEAEDRELGTTSEGEKWEGRGIGRSPSSHTLNLHKAISKKINKTSFPFH